MKQPPDAKDGHCDPRSNTQAFKGDQYPVKLHWLEGFIDILGSNYDRCQKISGFPERRKFEYTHKKAIKDQPESKAEWKRDEC